MSLTASLMVNSSPVEKIGKTLSEGLNFSVTLKDNTSILRPVLLLSSTSQAPITGYNYMYISDFGRYYFIDDVKSIHNNMWEVSAHVDVLETYKTAILANSAVIKRQQNLYNLYLDDPEFKTYNTEILQTKKFVGGSGFQKSMHYILVVNGSEENEARFNQLIENTRKSEVIVDGNVS